MSKPVNPAINLDGEQWKPWSKGYHVSDLGRVRSVVRYPRGDAKAYGGGLLIQHRTGTGYLVVYLCENNQRMRRYVHRMVLETFVGSCPKGYQGAHNNGLRDDCRLENLRWTTVVDNMADKKKHGTHLCGEQLPWSRLTPEKVRLIRSSTKSSGYFARLWGMNTECIRLARLGRTWKHVS